ncbi:MAG TPA: Rne/Rng family ribonuclease [Microlunatus sp.]
MLDSEPENTTTTGAGSTGQTQNPDAAPARPRRRAASRPAGPPSSAAAAELTTGVTPATANDSAPVAEAEIRAEGAPAKKTTAKKAAAKKTAAKKTAASKTATAKKTAAKKTTAKKATAKKATAKKATGKRAEAAPSEDVVAAEPVTEALTADAPTSEAPTSEAQTPQTQSADAAAAVAVPLFSDAHSVDAPSPADAPDTADGTDSVASAESAPAKKTSRTRKTTTRKRPARNATGSAQPVAEEQPEIAVATDGSTAAEPVPETDAAAAAPTEAAAESGEVAETDDLQAAIESALNAARAQRPQSADGSESSDAEHDDGDDNDEDADDEGDDNEGSEDRQGDGNRRRRRRRGGRRRRRGRDRDSDGPDESDGDSDDAQDDSADAGSDSAAKAADSATVDKADKAETAATESADSGSADAEPVKESADVESDDTDKDENGDSDDGNRDPNRRRRRRRRRRRGEDTGGSADDPTEVVVRVREPRKASDEVTGIDGSTRMEAKRQRRREGREAGRRRAPIISEAEFLARRESVNRKMIIRQRDDLAQIAVLEDGVLVEHYVDRESANSLIGNVYLGRVQNVLPSMEAAFIDIGRGRNAVLYAGEVDWDSYGVEGQDRKVEKVLKSGQTVLVQVTKDPIGAKGARLTNHVSIPGRYVVYAPGGHLSGISRKLPDNERKRLKEILDGAVADSASVIVRTAAEGASEDELTRDVNRLQAQWEDIEKKVKSGNAPQLLYAEPDLTLRIVRDLFTEDFSELIIQGNGSMSDAYDAIEAYVKHVAPHLADRMKHWSTDTEGDLFGHYRLDEQIAKGLERKVFLPSGGSLIIDRTEAMTVIDVNTGKFTGSGGNLEATITSNNLEAAEEIVRQLRLRDIGGIIVIDFIDMVLPNNRELLLRRLVECLGRDRTRHQVAEVTSLGLVQMTRKRIGTGLLEAFSTECPHCHGRGVELHDVPVADAKLADGGTRDDHGGGRKRRNRGGRKGGDKSEKGNEKSESGKDKSGSSKSDSGKSDSGKSESGRSEREHDTASVG